jgi:hypothetical protein
VFLSSILYSTVVLNRKQLKCCYLISAMFGMEDSGVCERCVVPHVAVSDADWDAGGLTQIIDGLRG